MRTHNSNECRRASHLALTRACPRAAYLTTDTKWNYGWTPTEARLRDVDRINNVLVENKESSVSRMGDRMSKKGTRVVFLCGQTKDGVLAPQTTTGAYKDKDSLVKQTWQSDISQTYTTTSWAWQCGQQGKLRDYHNNFDKEMFINWQVQTCAHTKSARRPLRTRTRAFCLHADTCPPTNHDHHTRAHTHPHTTCSTAGPHPHASAFSCVCCFDSIGIHPNAHPRYAVCLPGTGSRTA